MAKSSHRKSSLDPPDPREIVAVFGANLKAARLQAGLTQGQLADRAGLLQQYVSLVETGKQNVTLVTAQILADVVHREIRDLLERPKFRRAGRG
jgi:transcriptional regulator with XRE-family HTH domain